MSEKESEKEVVRELLWKAAGTTPVPAGPGSEAVFARASRLRWRRRAAATGVAAAVVATGLAFGPGVLGNHREANVASAPTAGEYTTGAGKFEKLLPSGTGKIREVSLGQLIKGTKKPWPQKKVGAYDGEYAVARDGGVGYLTVRVARPKDTSPDPAPCDMPHETPRKLNCVSEKVRDGVLYLWQWNWGTDGEPQWGSELYAELRLKDGTLLVVRDSTGFLGQGSQGPLLKMFPLTKAQLRELTLKPELLP